jgi:hypothetical protein
LTAVTSVPDCENVALQPWVIVWPAVKFQVSVHEVIALPRLVMSMLAPKPLGHCEVTV